jgi:hypothetical protein
MARGDYTAEIKQSLGQSPKGRLNKSPPKESPADLARDTKAGIKQNSPQDQKLDAMPQNQMPQRPQMPMQAQGGMPPDAHHVAAAAGIAHAILGGRGMV